MLDVDSDVLNGPQIPGKNKTRKPVKIMSLKLWTSNSWKKLQEKQIGVMLKTNS
jgi:hypothetical protein